MPIERSDLVLHGATGVTGRQMFRHLAANAPPGLRWTVSGRSRARLEALVRDAELGDRTPGIRIVDHADADALATTIAGTRVFLDAAGPYAAHGETCFGACVESLTDYVDIGGETFFLQRMLRRHHADAARRGVKLLPACGYEALPFDLATLLAVRRIRERFDQGCAEVKVLAAFHGVGRERASDVLSGGSVGTVKNLLALDRSDCLVDPACLHPETDDIAEVRARHAYALRPRLDPDLGAWTAPLFPAPFLNVPVVLRSAALHAAAGEPYGPSFRYVEGTDARTFSQRPPLQWLAATGLALGYGAIFDLFRHDRQLPKRALGSLLEVFAPEPGEGPSQQALDGGGCTLHVFARSERGELLRGSVVAQGHAGYKTTGTMAAEAALALATRRETLPPFAGLVTPATGLGLAVRENLKRAGLEFSIE